MNRVLIIGGTRNLGPSITRDFIEAGYTVSVLNRGVTPGELPEDVERLKADRGDTGQMKAALGGRDFDVVVDTTLYNAADAGSTVDLLAGRVGRYIFVSTGQVYLLRTGLKRPYRETDYVGPVIPAPPRERQFDYDNWLYGFDKRGAEDVLFTAWSETNFPFVTLRLPMVNSERDHFERIHNYVSRLQDGGPILLPEGDHLVLRHVYGEDVAKAVVKAASVQNVEGSAINVSQDDELTIHEFLTMVGRCVGREMKTLSVPVDLLEARGLYPDCSPFSEPWMSELDNQLSKEVLGMTYTRYEDYIPKIVNSYLATHPPSGRSEAPMPTGYAKRAVELELASRFQRATRS